MDNIKLTRNEKLKIVSPEDPEFNNLEVQEINGNLIVGYYYNDGTDESCFAEVAWYSETQ